MVSQKFHPSIIRRKSYKHRVSFWRARCSCSISSTPTLGTCTIRGAPKRYGFENKKDIFKRPIGVQGTEISLLKDSHIESLTLEPSIKTAVWKAHRPYVKEIHLLILKHLLEGQEPIGTLSGNRSDSGCHFCVLCLSC